MKKTICLLLSGLMVLNMNGVHVQAEETTDITIDVNYEYSYAESIYEQLNQLRSEKTSYSSLVYDETLGELAEQRAAELTLSYSNTRPDGSKLSDVYEVIGTDAESLSKDTTALLSGKYKAAGVGCAVDSGSRVCAVVYSTSGNDDGFEASGTVTEPAAISVISSALMISTESQTLTIALGLNESEELLSSYDAEIVYGSKVLNGKVKAFWTVKEGSEYVSLDQENMTVTGIRRGKAILASGKITCNVLVDLDVESVEYESSVTTASGTAPALPEKAVLVFNDGSKEEVTISYDAYDEKLYQARKGGTFTVTGRAGDEEITVEVTVTPAVVESIDDVEVTTLQNQTPELPKTVTVHWSNGDESEEKVVWEEKTYGTVGTVKVTGTLENGETVTAVVTVKKPTQDMYRLYNRNSGEHFYTADSNEKDYLVKAGWTYEGIGWVAPSYSKDPVYRLYNKNAGDHHYTMNKAERDHLISLGWKDEGIGWYSDPNKTVPLYRQYNPNKFANNHNYTTAKNENDKLISLGWRGEGIGWYAVGEGKPVVKQKVQYTPVYYSQRDSRWAYKSYAIQGCSIGSNGCRPTNIAMAFSGILGTAVYPDEVADWLYYNTDQWCTRVKGGSGLAAPMAAEHWGVECKGLSNPDEIRQALKDGCIILGDVGRGTFVAGSGSHALTLFGYNEADDTTMVYDSYSTNLNGRYTISSLWNQRSTDPDDANGGYLFYAFYK